VKSREEIKEKIETLKNDPRMKGFGTPEYKPARVDINAPLALIQVSIETQIDVLRWVLEGADS
jgi:hypothetical protein